MMIEKIKRNSRSNGKHLIGIYTFRDVRFVLNHPIFYLLTVEDDEMNGYYRPLDIYSFSGTVMEITEEIKTDILDLYAELSGIPNNQLGEYPKIWKAHLNEIIKCK